MHILQRVDVDTYPTMVDSVGNQILGSVRTLNSFEEEMSRRAGYVETL